MYGVYVCYVFISSIISYDYCYYYHYHYYYYHYHYYYCCYCCCCIRHLHHLHQHSTSVVIPSRVIEWIGSELIGQLHPLAVLLEHVVRCLYFVGSFYTYPRSLYYPTTID